jgi:hypothetical protein
MEGPRLLSNARRLLKPALLLSLLGLAMTIGAMIRLRPYIHGRYDTDPRVWQREPLSCAASLVGLFCIALGFWLFFSEDDLDDSDEETPRNPRR